MSRASLIGAAGLLLLGSLAARARAAEPRVHVRASPDSCPSAALISEKLRPLLGEERAVTIDEADDPAGPHVDVEDLGAHYTVDMDGSVRDVPDAARDCVERARVAAVFVALNLHAVSASARGIDGLPARAAAEPTEPRRDVAESRTQRSSYGARLLLEGAYATGVARAAWGVGAGAWWMVRPWRIALDAAAMTAVAFDLTPAGRTRASVEMLRFPIGLNGGALWALDRWELGPTLGVAFDVLRLSGKGVSQTDAGVRANVGLNAGAQIRLLLDDTWAVVAGASASVYPRAYDVSVEPLGTLGRTPVLWLDASCGMDWRF